MGKGDIKAWLVGILGLLCAFAQASSPCEKEIHQFELLKDQGLSLEEAISATNYQRIDEIQLGYTSDTVWIRFTIPQRCEEETYLNFDFWGLDYLNLYLVKNGKAIDSLFTGYLRQLSTREKQIPQFVKSLPENFTAGDTVYVKMWKLEGTMMSAVYLQDESALQAQTQGRKMTLLFFLGVCFIMLALSLSYYIYFRLNMFLWYAALLVVFSFKKVINFGYGNLYLWKDNDWLTIYSRSIWMAPSMLFFLLFAHQLLKVKEYSPKWVHVTHMVLVYTMLVEFFLSLLPLPPYPWRIGMYIIFISAIGVTAATYFYAAVKAIRKKHLPGYLFLACELILLVTTILLAFRNFSIIPLAWVPENLHILMFILLLPVTLFSLIAYTKTMHVVKVKEEILVPYKPDPKPLNEDEVKKAEEAYETIQKFFEEKKPYLDPDLTVDTLAETIHLHSHLISRAINTFAEKHFFDFVNSYRVEEAKKLLLDQEAQKVYTIEGIAGMSGFKNKTTFNKAFKKFTGQTPSSYRQDKS